jgi:hypothetical protein
MYWSPYTVLSHTLCSLDAFCAACPRHTVIPASALVVHRDRTSSAAWSNLFSGGPGRLHCRLRGRLDSRLGQVSMSNGKDSA